MINNTLQYQESILINKGAKQVWEGLTNPAIIKSYLYGTNTITSWEENSPIVFEGEWEGNGYRDEGVVVEFKPYQLIKYSYWSGFSGLPNLPENRSLISYLLEEQPDGTTKFTWGQVGFATEENLAHSKNNMTKFLTGIKKEIEARC